MSFYCHSLHFKFDSSSIYPDVSFQEIGFWHQPPGRTVKQRPPLPSSFNSIGACKYSCNLTLTFGILESTCCFLWLLHILLTSEQGWQVCRQWIMSSHQGRWDINTASLRCTGLTPKTWSRCGGISTSSVCSLNTSCCE